MKPPSPAQPATILVIEDNAPQLQMIDQVLRTAGYRILLASNGGEAAKHWDREAVSIDLVLADIAMPGLSGPELVREFRSIRPDLKAMIISGTDDPAALESIKTSGASVFLAKPFNHRDLLRDVAGALAG
jgi:two-component system cell cycle sensor histidine kinase/response regulator CckA